MMTCRAVRDSLPEYATGRSISAQERIEEHLSRCASCAAVERELRAVFAALASAAAPPESASGEARARLALGTAAAHSIPSTGSTAKPNTIQKRARRPVPGAEPPDYTRKNPRERGSDSPLQRGSSPVA